MKKEKQKGDKASALRRQAEERLSEHPKPSKMSKSDSALLIHELQVHQIELEIQNEELRQAQTIIENSNRRFSDLYDFAPVGYLILEKEGRIIEANLKAAEVLGFEKRDLVNKPFHVFVHPEDKDILYLHLRSLRKNTSETCEIRLTKKNEELFPAQLVSTPLAGPAEGFLIAFLDLTARKSAEEKLAQQNVIIEAGRQQWESSIEDLNERLLVSNRELEALGHTLSHDLRAPLRSIEGFSTILLERHAENLDADGKEFLKIINKSIQRMREMISGLLNISSIARAEIRREKIDISALVRDIVQERRMADPARTVEFSIKEGLFADGDAKLLRIALDNLIHNAWKFTRNRPIAHIEFGKTECGGKAAFFLRDNGAGFDMKNASKLFTVFQRLHSESEFEGTGVGLATVQRIVRRHGGEIRAEGEVDKGATFYFTLS